MRFSTGRLAPIWIPWLLCVVGTLLTARAILAGGTDFAIYLQAARELGSAQDPYRSHPDHGAFAYPPVVLLVFRGLDGLGNEMVLRWLHSVSLGLATTCLAFDLIRLVGPWAGRRPWRWLLLAILCGRFVTSNYTNGQLSLWVAALCTHGIRRVVAAQSKRGGLALGAATAMKLTPALLLVALVYHRCWRAAVFGVISLLVLVLVLPWPFLGDVHWLSLRQFWQAMIGPLLTGGGDEAVWNGSSASISGTLDFLLQARRHGANGEVLCLIDLSPGVLSLVKTLYTLAIVAVAVIGLRRFRAQTDAIRLTGQLSLWLLLMALLSPLSRTYHLAAVMLPAALFCHLGPSRGTVLWWSASALLALAMPLRQRALLGETLWRGIDQAGVLHFGLVAMLLWIALWAPKIAVCRADPT